MLLSLKLIIIDLYSNFKLENGLISSFEYNTIPNYHLDFYIN